MVRELVLIVGVHNPTLILRTHKRTMRLFAMLSPQAQLSRQLETRKWSSCFQPAIQEADQIQLPLRQPEKTSSPSARRRMFMHLTESTDAVSTTTEPIVYPISSSFPAVGQPPMAVRNRTSCFQARTLPAPLLNELQAPVPYRETVQY